MCDKDSSEPRSELTCLHVVWLAVPVPVGAGVAGLVVRGAAVCVELLVLGAELHAVKPTAHPATRIAAVILAGLVDLSVMVIDLTSELLFMRPCSPASGR
jgi:hypothetical protein